MIRLGIGSLVPSPSRPLPATIAKALTETAAWCSLDTPLASGLRSPELNPSRLLSSDPFPDSRTAIDAWLRRRYEQYRHAVSSLTQHRSQLLDAMSLPAMDHNATTPSQGQILLCFPMETVSCGAAEAASRGFFDAEDVPPWDTWFWYAGQAILCWVPDGFISRAQAGIDANPVDCIHWASNRDVAHLTEHE